MKKLIATTLAAAVLCTSAVTAVAAPGRMQGVQRPCDDTATFSPTLAFGAAGAAGQTDNSDTTARLCAFQSRSGMDGGMPGMNGDMGRMPQMNGQRPDMSGIWQDQMPGQFGQNDQQSSSQTPDADSSATPVTGGRQNQRPTMNDGQQSQQFGGQMPQMNDQNSQSAATATSASTIVTGETTNSAASLTVNEAKATVITVSDTNSQVKITESGTYVVTGTCSDGNITVKKGVTGVVLILKDLDLTSTTGATVSVNKESQVKLVISGTVQLTDAENAADENSSDTAVADAFDGAAIKVKDGASAVITGTGTLTVNGSAKNGIKAGDDTVLVIDGPTVNITAANDGINGNYDVAILTGTVTVSAGDDGIHADRILTIGSASASPTVTVKSSTEGLEGTVVNIAGGTISITASDDAINAANSDNAFSELTFSINQTGGSVTVSCRGDGYDSNGNINLVAGSASISSGSNGGEAGIDYVGAYYLSDGFQLDNRSGVASDAMMGGRGGMMGQMPQMNGQQDQNGQSGQQGQFPGQNNQGGQGSSGFGSRQKPDTASGATPSANSAAFVPTGDAAAA